MSLSYSEWLVYMVQIEATSTPECHKGVQSQGGQWREKHRVVHHVQEEYYEGHIEWPWVIKQLVYMVQVEAPSTLSVRKMSQDIPGGQREEEHEVSKKVM